MQARRWAASAFFCAALIGSAAFGAAPKPVADLVIADVTLISPERDTPLPHAWVRLEGSKIAQVSSMPLHGAQEIDGRGKFLIPGLIDSHVHLDVRPDGFPSGMKLDQAKAHPDIVMAAHAQEPRSFLFYGFTTVIDLISTGERTARWNALPVRPDAYFCGALATGGGKTFRVSYPVFSYDQSKRINFTPLETSAAVATIAGEGAVCVKTFFDKEHPATVDEGKALVLAAHEHGLPVFIHANREDGQAFAVAMGVDAIVHGMWRYQGEPVALDAQAREILATIAKTGIGYQPTTQVMVGLDDMRDKQYFERPELKDAYPASLVAWYAGQEGGWYAQQMRAGGLDSDLNVRGTIARATSVTSILAQANAHLLFGTDTPSDAVYTNPPGLNGRLEMNNWVAAGVSLSKLLSAMTLDNAREVHLDDRIGSIEPGKTANLLLLGANPLESVAAYDTINMVILHGQPIARETLSARSLSK